MKNMIGKSVFGYIYKRLIWERSHKKYRVRRLKHDHRKVIAFSGVSNIAWRDQLELKLELCFSELTGQLASLFYKEGLIVIKEIKNLDASKASQEDDIPTKIIKENSDVFSNYIISEL